MLVKFSCEYCNKEVEKEFKAPRFCGVDCRLGWLRSLRRKSLIKNNPSTSVEEEIKQNEEVVPEPVPSPAPEPEPIPESVPEPVPEVPVENPPVENPPQ